MSTHNPAIAKKAVEMGLVEMILFSINPAFDMLPPTEDIDTYFAVMMKNLAESHRSAWSFIVSANSMKLASLL